jgi:formate/nitrite transporter
MEMHNAEFVSKLKVNRFRHDLFKPSYLTESGSILGGIFIAFGGLFMLVLKDAGYSKLIFSASFSIGLFLVVTCHGELFTGNCLIAPFIEKEDKDIYYRMLIINFFGNFAGVSLVALLLIFSGIDISMVNQLAIDKCSIPWNELIIRGILCNILVCIAVYGANYVQSNNSPLSKFIAVALPVTLFIFCGFEHSIANMFFLLLGAINDSISVWQMICQLFFVTIGNYIGGVFFGCLVKQIVKELLY